eukprot:scaffold1208_cov113-Isochrysis_galbana.AAC.6
MVPSMSDPFESTAAELAGEDPAVSEMYTAPPALGGVGVWEYKLSGGAQLAPHRLYVLARLLTPPERGVGRPPRDSPPPSEHEV